MYLRPATLADIPQLTTLFLRLKQGGPYAFIPHDLPTAQRAMRQCVSGPGKYLRVIVAGDVLVAALMGGTQPFWWGKRRYASDYALFSQIPRGGEWLVRDFCGWAWKQPGVVEVLMGQSSGDAIEATRALFEGLGFERVGGIFRLTRYEAMGREA